MRRKITGLLLVSILAATTVCGCGRGAGSDGTTVSVQENVSDLAGEEETSDSGCYLSFGDVPKEEFVVKLEEAGIPEDTLLVGVNTVYDENAMVQLNHMLKEQGYGLTWFSAGFPTSAVGTRPSLISQSICGNRRSVWIYCLSGRGLCLLLQTRGC